MKTGVDGKFPSIARHAPYLSRHPLTVHHASLNYWLIGKEQYSVSSTKQPSVHFLCCRFVQPLACPFYPYPTWQSICCAQWPRWWQLRRWWYRDGARLLYPEASHDIDPPGLLSRYFSPSHLAMIGIWSEDDWPLLGDTVKQTNKQTNKQKINDKPKTKKTITFPAQGVGVRISSDEEDQIWVNPRPPPPPPKKSPWTKNLPPKIPWWISEPWKFPGSIKWYSTKKRKTLEIEYSCLFNHHASWSYLFRI